MEFPNTSTSYESVTWSQHLQGKLAALDSQGNTDVLSFQPQSQQSVGQPRQAGAEESYAVPMPNQQTGIPYTPKWLKPKCGARFGFGGKLVSF